MRQIPTFTLTTSSSTERHMTASETSTTEASIPMVTTFTGTATVFPVSTAVFKISESCREKERETQSQREWERTHQGQFSNPQTTVNGCNYTYLKKWNGRLVFEKYIWGDRRFQCSTRIDTHLQPAAHLRNSLLHCLPFLSFKRMSLCHSGIYSGDNFEHDVKVYAVSLNMHLNITTYEPP